MPNYDKSQLQELLSNLVDEKLGEQELKELQALLRDDPDAQQFYIRYTMLHSWLTWDYVEQTPAESRLLSLNKQADESAAPSPILDFLGDVSRNTFNFFNTHSPLSFVLLFAFVGVALLGTLFLSTAPNGGVTTEESPFVASITPAKDCKWSTAIAPPTELRAGQQLLLEKGLVQITYANKASVLLEGPVSYRVESPNSGFLRQGKLTARAESNESRKFTIVTPTARFVDLGTEFGVMIDDKGRSAVAVFEGKVNAEAKMADGRWANPVSYGKGQAAVCMGATFTDKTIARSEFPSLLPPPPPPLDPSYQRWLQANQDMQKRQDLIVYYDFELDLNNPNVLLNRAPSGSALNGEIQNPAWVQGRFSEKSALEFKDKNSGVRINLPGEYQKMTLIAWIKSDQLANEYNGILMSDNWKRLKELHWGIWKKGNVELCVFGQKISDDSQQAIPADSLNRWCMVAGVIDVPNRSALYLNGEPFENMNSTEIPAINIGSATIGGCLRSDDPSTTNKSYNLSGRMDELMIFNRVLSAEEIQRMYENGKPGNISAPPPPSRSYKRWLAANQELKNHPDMVAYYDFQTDPNNSNLLLNQAGTGVPYNGEIQNTKWVQGRFPGKNALEFKEKNAGVRVNLSGEYPQMTLIAWVNSKRFENNYNCILFSDGWKQLKKLHWQIRKDGLFEMSIFGQKGGSYTKRTFPDDCLDRWCMIAGVIKPPKETVIYLNGELFETLVTEEMPAVRIGSAMIGGWNDSESSDMYDIRTLSGRMDELMIFQKALSAEDIKRIYEAGKP